MEMTGRMERVENRGEQRRGFASQRQVHHPPHRPLEIATAIPTFPQPRRRRYSLTNLQTTKPRGHFYWALTRLFQSIAIVLLESLQSFSERLLSHCVAVSA